MNNFYNYPYYRASPPPPPAKISPPPKKKRKLDLISLKKNTCTSLCDIEHFLCNFNDFVKYIKLYKLLKK